LLALALAWANYLLTARWAGEAGALHGWRSPWYAAALVASTILAAVWWRRPGTTHGGERAMATASMAAGAALLAAALFSAFPPSAWPQIPFYDDWPGLMQIAASGVELLKRGAVVGWNWDFLGGYHTSADLGQSLALTALLPIQLFGRNVGFHVLLLAFVALVPLAVYLDLRLEGDRRGATLSAALACVLTAGYFATIMRSGMANSVGGVAFVGFALAGSHAARLGRRWGGAMLVVSLTLVLYTHAAFYIYAAALLGIEALFYRSWRMAWRSAFALTVAFAGAIPLHWELVRYPAFFQPNNLYWAAPPSFDWAGFARNVYYAFEILLRPGRWFNDYVGVAHVWLPVIVVVAMRGRSRAVFYAWASLATILLLRFNTPQLGIVLAREMYLYPLLLGPVLAAMVRALPTRPPLAPAVLAVLFAFVAVPFQAVWHEPDVAAFAGPVIGRMSAAPGGMVLVENDPHWNMVATPGQRSVRSRFNSHYESLLPEATGKRFFGQPQDGYHRSIFRGWSLAGGAYQGKLISDTPPDRFAADMRRWGVARLFVWSGPASRYLQASPQFALQWRSGPWLEYALVDADVREVVTAHGSGTLASHDPLGATVSLSAVTAGDLVVVRTNYFPAWEATSGGRPVGLFASDGQLAFRAPRDGSYAVHLHYPRRTGLLALSWAVVILGAWALSSAWPRQLSWRRLADMRRHIRGR
jgi:hypothetical protein